MIDDREMLEIEISIHKITPTVGTGNILPPLSHVSSDFNILLLFPSFYIKI